MPLVKFVEMSAEDGMHVFYAGGVASQECNNLASVQVHKKSVSTRGPHSSATARRDPTANPTGTAPLPRRDATRQDHADAS